MQAWAPRNIPVGTKGPPNTVGSRFLYTIHLVSPPLFPWQRKRGPPFLSHLWSWTTLELAKGLELGFLFVLFFPAALKLFLEEGGAKRKKKKKSVNKIFFFRPPRAGPWSLWTTLQLLNYNYWLLFSVSLCTGSLCSKFTADPSGPGIRR